jgi:hypothetical protein
MPLLKFPPRFFMSSEPIALPYHFVEIQVISYSFPPPPSYSCFSMLGSVNVLDGMSGDLELEPKVTKKSLLAKIE